MQLSRSVAISATSESELSANDTLRTEGFVSLAISRRMMLYRFALRRFGRWRTICPLGRHLLQPRYYATFHYLADVRSERRKDVQDLLPVSRRLDVGQLAAATVRHAGLGHAIV